MIVVAKPMSTTGQTDTTVTPMNVDPERHRSHTPPSSPTIPPSSPPASTFVGSLKNSSAYSALSINPKALDTKTAGGGLVGGAAMDVDLPVDGTMSDSEDATSRGTTGAGTTGGGTVGMGVACGGTTDKSTIGEVTTGGGSMTGDPSGTGLLGHEGGPAGGSATGGASEGSTAGVKPNMGLHVSA